jgi:DNA-binding MarR family transcriptional regulator
MGTKTLKRPVTLDTPDAPLAALLASAGRAATEAEKRLELKSIKPPFLSILWLIDSEPGHAQGEYAAALHYDLATFGRHVEALVSDGYLIKTQAEHDHRVMELRLTAAGEAKIREKGALLHRLDTILSDAMGRDEVQRLRRLLASYLMASAAH